MSSTIVKFRDWWCDIVFDWYAVNSRISIELVDHEDGQTVAHATVNMPEYDLPPNEVIIKNYSEGEGMLDALVDAGLIKATGNMIQTGFVYCPICKLNMDMLPKHIADQVKLDYEYWQEAHQESKNEEE